MVELFHLKRHLDGFSNAIRRSLFSAMDLYLGILPHPIVQNASAFCRVSPFSRKSSSQTAVPSPFICTLITLLCAIALNFISLAIIFHPVKRYPLKEIFSYKSNPLWTVYPLYRSITFLVIRTVTPHLRLCLPRLKPTVTLTL